MRSFLAQWIENPTRIDGVIQETVKKWPKIGHFFELARYVSTTHQHISHTIACGKGVSYMYVDTCKAALAGCLMKSVINTVLCEKFHILGTFSTQGCPFDTFRSQIANSDFTSVFPVKKNPYPFTWTNRSSNLSLPFTLHWQFDTPGTVLKWVDLLDISLMINEKNIYNLRFNDGFGCHHA